MSKVSTETSPRFGSPLVIGALTLLSAALSLAINRSGGEWPLGLGGWGAAGFALAGSGFVGYYFYARHSGRRD